MDTWILGTKTQAVVNMYLLKVKHALLPTQFFRLFQVPSGSSWVSESYLLQTHFLHLQSMTAIQQRAVNQVCARRCLSTCNHLFASLSRLHWQFWLGQQRNIFASNKKRWDERLEKMSWGLVWDLRGQKISVMTNQIRWNNSRCFFTWCYVSVFFPSVFSLKNETFRRK